MTWAELNVDGYLLTGAFELTSMRLCSGPGSETFATAIGTGGETRRLTTHGRPMNFTNCRQGFCGAHSSGKTSNGVKPIAQ